MKTPKVFYQSIRPRLYFPIILVIGLLFVSFTLDNQPYPLEEGLYSNDVVCDETNLPLKLIFSYEDAGTCKIPPGVSATCKGDEGFLGDLVNIVVRDAKSPDKIFFEGLVSQGTIFEANAFRVTNNNKFGKKTMVEIKDPNHKNVLQTIVLETPCYSMPEGGIRYGAVVLNQVVISKKLDAAVRCDPEEPDIPYCELKAGRIFWQNDINIDFDEWEITADTKFGFSDGVHSYILPIPSLYIPKNATITIESFVAWYGTLNHNPQNYLDQRFRLEFLDAGGNIVMRTRYTGISSSHDGIYTGGSEYSDDWEGAPAIVGGNDTLQSAVTSLRLKHYSNGDWGGKVYPASICIYYTENFLPIDLMSFEATRVNDQVDLHWATASEINNEFFEIYRSSDGENFSIVETMPGAGNSNSQIDYHCIDDNPYPGYNYYQLAQVDLDGKSSMSNIISVFVGDRYDDEINITIFPNPIRTTLNYEIEKPRYTGGQLDIIDLLGRTVYTRDLENTPDQEISDYLEINDFTDGVYYMRVRIDTWVKMIPFEVIRESY